VVWLSCSILAALGLQCASLEDFQSHEHHTALERATGASTLMGLLYSGLSYGLGTSTRDFHECLGLSRRSGVLGHGLLEEAVGTD
jgi:hypothetical protein